MTGFLTTTQAAERKGCTRQAIHNAITRGDLNATKVGPVWAVADDDALDAYQVQETGGRLHRQRAEAENANTADVSADT